MEGGQETDRLHVNMQGSQRKIKITKGRDFLK